MDNVVKNLCRKDTSLKHNVLKAFVVMRSQRLNRSHDHGQAQDMGRQHEDIPHISDSTKISACLLGGPFSKGKGIIDWLPTHAADCFKG